MAKFEAEVQSELLRIDRHVHERLRFAVGLLATGGQQFVLVLLRCPETHAL